MAECGTQWSTWQSVGCGGLGGRVWGAVVYVVVWGAVV